MKSSNEDKVKGTAKDLGGKIKESAGKLVGNEKLQAEGQADQVEGKIQKKSATSKRSSINKTTLPRLEKEALPATCPEELFSQHP